MSLSRPGVRAGEPVGAPESRCSGAPLLTCKRIAWKRWELAVPPGAILVIFLQASTRRNTVLPLWLPAYHWLLREEMKALRAWWGDVRGACREPELDRSGLSTWQGRTHAPAPCQCEEAPWEATTEHAVITSRLSMEGKSTRVNAERCMPLGQARAAWG